MVSENDGVTCWEIAGKHSSAGIGAKEHEWKTLHEGNTLRTFPVCKVCGAVAGELATDCPGYFLSAEEKEATRIGELDFVGGVWTGPCIDSCR